MRNVYLGMLPLSLGQQVDRDTVLLLGLRNIRAPLGPFTSVLALIHRYAHPITGQYSEKTKKSSKSRRKQFSSCDACRRSRLSCDASKRGHQAGQVRWDGSCSRCSRKGHRCTFEVGVKRPVSTIYEADLLRDPKKFLC